MTVKQTYFIYAAIFNFSSLFLWFLASNNLVMTSFGKVDLASDSDSDDADYDPTKDGANKNLSEEEESGDDEGREDGHRSKGSLQINFSLKLSYLILL